MMTGYGIRRKYVVAVVAVAVKPIKIDCNFTGTVISFSGIWTELHP